MSDYCTPEELRAELGIYDIESDDLLTVAISAASRQVEEFCGRRFWLDDEATTRTFVASDGCTLDLLDQPGDAPKVEIGSLEDLVISTDEDGSGVFGSTATGYLLQPLNALDDGRPYSQIAPATGSWWPRWAGRPCVQITARFGWPAVPPEVKKATLLQAAQLYKSKDAVFGAVAMGESGAMFVRPSLNPTAKALLAGVARVPVG